MMKIDILEKEDGVIISIEGDISFTTVDTFENAYKKYMNSTLKVIALDLLNMPSLDSFGISRIIKMSRSFTENGKDFVLINMNENIHQIFRMGTFDKLFTIMSSEDFYHKYFPLHKPDKIRKNAVRNEVINTDVQKDAAKKINQIEIEDDNGTTLIFVDEE